MRPFSNQQYEPLPEEEKVEDALDPRKGGQKWGKTLISILISFLALSAIVTLVSKHNATDGEALPIFPFATDFDTDRSAQEDAEAFLSRATGQQYLLGIGKADITGFVQTISLLWFWLTQPRPIVELNFMGYASLAQIGTGLRQR